MEKDKLDLNYDIRQYLFITATYLIIALILSFRRGTLHRFKTNFFDKWFVLMMFIMAGYMVYGFAFTKDQNYRKAVMQGITAFIIAICARLDLIFIPFFLVFNLHYHLAQDM